MSFQCIACSIRQVNAVLDRMDMTDERKTECMRQVCKLLSEASPEQSPPSTARAFYDLLEHYTGIADPYREIKESSNRRVREIYEILSEDVNRSNDPLRAALCAAAAGNIIDYGASSGVADGDIVDSFEKALTAGVDTGFYDAFRASAEKSRSILYLADNAGEIFFDKLLIEHLPREKVCFVVRGGPIINDVTRDDAVAAGVSDLVKVIDTGVALPGIEITASSHEFVSAFRQADMIISKGQGNLETLWDAQLGTFSENGADIFYVLKIKCAVVASLLNKNVGETAYIHKRIEAADGRRDQSMQRNRNQAHI